MLSKKIRKYTIGLVLFLAQQALIGVGFSSWLVLGGTDTITTNGIIKAADVFDSIPYVSMNTAKGENGSGMTTLHYNSMGFVSDSIVVSSYNVKYYIEYDISKFYNDYPNYNSTNLSIDLSLRNCTCGLLNLVSTDNSSVNYVLGTNRAYSEGLNSLSATFTKNIVGSNVENVSTLLSLNQFDKTTYNNTYNGKYMFLEISYNFKKDSNTYESLFNDIKNKDISFSFNVFIEGVTDNEA